MKKLKNLIKKSINPTKKDLIKLAKNEIAEWQKFLRKLEGEVEQI